MAREQSHSNGSHSDGGGTAEEIAEEAGLRWTTDSAPGIRRVKHGKGFVYRNPGGAAPGSRELERIVSLVIPPAWTDVWICPSSRGHIQATGRDARGRKQYIYHPDWVAARDATKYEHLLAVGRALPRVRACVARDLRRGRLDRSQALALSVRLLDETAIRVGNESYARQNGSFGLSTLRRGNVRISESRARLKFTGKGGKLHEIEVSGRKLARLLAECRDLPGQHLFGYRDDEGVIREIHSDDVNQYLSEASGIHFTAKDFRTWMGSTMAARELAEIPRPESMAASKRAINAAMKTVAAELRNTPAVCRKSYVHPLLLEAFEAGTLQAGWHANRSRWGSGPRDPAERLLLWLLQRAN